MIRLFPTAKISRAAAIRFFAVVLVAVAIAAYAISRPQKTCRWNIGDAPNYACAAEASR